MNYLVAVRTHHSYILNSSFARRACEQFEMVDNRYVPSDWSVEELKVETTAVAF